MEHPKQIPLILKTKSNNIKFDLAHFPARERNVFTFNSLAESLYETKKVVQVIAQDVCTNAHAVSYYPEDEFMLWYFKKPCIDRIPNNLVDLESQKKIISFALYNFDPSQRILRKYYDSTSTKSPFVKCCTTTLIIGHVVLYSALCFCVAKVLTNA